MLRKTVVVAILIAAAVAIADELAVGDHAPAFTLTNAENGKAVSFVPADGRLKVVVFTCNQCPYAKAFAASDRPRRRLREARRRFLRHQPE